MMTRYEALDSVTFARLIRSGIDVLQERTIRQGIIEFEVEHRDVLREIFRIPGCTPAGILREPAHTTTAVMLKTIATAAVYASLTACSSGGGGSGQIASDAPPAEDVETMDAAEPSGADESDYPVRPVATAPYPDQEQEIRPTERFNFPDDPSCFTTAGRVIDENGFSETPVRFGFDETTGIESYEFEYFTLGESVLFEYSGTIMGCNVTFFYFEPIR